MKLSVLNKQLRDEPFSRQIEIVAECGYDGVCLGTGGLAHATVDACYAQKLVNDDLRIAEYKNILKANNVEVMSFACIANPVHPQKRIQRKMDGDLRASILVAEKFGVDTVTTMSGCPGDHPGGIYPNWIAYGWPLDATKVKNYQWNEVLIPFWKDLSKFALDHGVTHIGLELHPNMCCYNYTTLMRLREAVGEVIGVCYDPSHPFYLGMDSIQAIREFGKQKCIFAIHGKDILVRQRNLALNGWFDGVSDYAGKSWQFTIPGYGHDDKFWSNFVFELHQAGYDRDICNENEDQQMDGIEAMQKYVQFLKPIVHNVNAL